MEFKGTKEWELHYEGVDEDNSTPRFVIMGQGGELNLCSSEYAIYSANSVDEFKANAHLTASALDLLEACIEVVETSEGSGVMNEEWMRIRLKEVINKALNK